MKNIVPVLVAKGWKSIVAANSSVKNDSPERAVLLAPAFKLGKAVFPVRNIELNQTAFSATGTTASGSPS